MLNGKDIAGNEVIVQKKVVSLDLDRPVAPVINSNAGYPIMTSYGITYDGTTIITYDSRTDIDNYYSIDNGTTWLVYTGQFNVTSGTVIAKSIKRSTGLEVVISKTISMPSDALRTEAYDNNDATYVTAISNKIIVVDSSMQGKNIMVKSKQNSSSWGGNGTIYVKFLDQSNNVISQYTKGTGIYNDIINIPINTKNISCSCVTGYSSYGDASPSFLYEIQASNEPTFSSVNGYMLLTADPTKAIKEPYQMVTVNYFETSVQRLYRIGTTGDWLTYNDQAVKVKQGETIYGKGIDQNGNETRIISSYTANVADALKLQAYDGNDLTYVTAISNQLMDVDSSMQGRNIIIKNKQNSSSWGGNGTIYVKFLDENKNLISQYTKATGTYNDIVTIPINTKVISCSCVTGYSSYGDASPSFLYEIQASNEPTFTPINGYMLLTSDPTKAIKEPYQMVTVNYFPTSVQRLYRIGTIGDWLSYNDQSIKVKQGEIIYTKGIDQYGNETRIISSYTSNVVDALKAQVYDGDDTTYVTAISNNFMAVDNDMQGKSINIKSKQNSSSWGGNGTLTIKFLDQNKTLISQYVKATGTFSDTILVPVNTKWLSCSCVTGYSSYGDASPSYLFEIKPIY